MLLLLSGLYCQIVEIVKFVTEVYKNPVKCVLDRIFIYTPLWIRKRQYPDHTPPDHFPDHNNSYTRSQTQIDGVIWGIAT